MKLHAGHKSQRHYRGTGVHLGPSFSPQVTVTNTDCAKCNFFLRGNHVENGKSLEEKEEGENPYKSNMALHLQSGGLMLQL